MFVWECINTEGRHIGMCVDTFMFGSCCAHNLTTSQLGEISESSEPAILYSQTGMRPSPSRPYKPKQKPSTTVRPAFFLPNHNDGDRGGSSVGRPINNQIRPNDINYDVNNVYTYSNMDKSNTNWSTSPKPSHSLFPTPSQHFQNSLPDRLGIQEKPDETTRQSSSRPPTQDHIWTNPPTEFLQTAASNLRPNFVSRPTILSTMLPVQHRFNSSHFITSTTTSTTTSAVSTITNK